MDELIYLFVEILLQFLISLLTLYSSITFSYLNFQLL